MQGIFRHQNYGCMFPGFPLLNLDNDQWKHTMFTNEFSISVHHFNNILQGNVLMANTILAISNDMHKNDKKSSV